MAKLLTPEQIENCKIICLLGGPGVGKSWHCKELITKFPKLSYFSVGELLKAKHSPFINAHVTAGTIVPPDITLRVILEKVAELYHSPEKARVFLVDGFPRTLEQVKEGMKVLLTWNFTLFLDAPENILRARVAERRAEESRVDDDAVIVDKRIQTYLNTTLPVVSWLENEDEVFERVDCSSENWTEVNQRIAEIVEKKLQSHEWAPGRNGAREILKRSSFEGLDLMYSY